MITFIIISSSINVSICGILLKIRFDFDSIGGRKKSQRANLCSAVHKYKLSTV